jgi:CheY-like chemotaxis protein
MFIARSYDKSPLIVTDTPSILVVDDEIVNRSIASAVLKNAGWSVSEADDGASAVTAACGHRYALVLMDIQMPGMSGFEAARAIRSGGASASAPILAFTALSATDVDVRAGEAGMDGYLGKPFTPEALLAAVEPWRPDGSQGIARLAAIFGADEMALLLRGFVQQLAEAIDADEGWPDRRARAHKLAGVSGTLGFADLSAAMLRVSEGDQAGWPAARREARKALASIPA